jgi:hypothetical protein
MLTFSLEFLIRILLIFTFCLFVLLAGFLLPTYLKDVRQQELDRVRRVFSAIGNTSAFLQAEDSVTSFAMRYYVAPVIFTTFLVFMLSAISFFGSAYSFRPDYILTAAHFGDAGYQQFYSVNTLMVISFAFFGSFVWSIQYILLRIMSRDINPGQFYQIGISIIFAVILAIVMRHFLNGIGFFPFLNKVSGVGDEGQTTGILAALAFLIGLFPGFFLEWLRHQFEAKWFGRGKRADDLSLDQVEGIDSAASFRLREMDIQNTQNLSCVNPVTLYMRTRYGLNQTIDWVAQAQLLTILKFDKTIALRSFGIRTIFDLTGLVSSLQSSNQNDTDLRAGTPSVHIAICESLGISWTLLRYLTNSRIEDPSFTRLKELREALIPRNETCLVSPALSSSEEVASSALAVL